MSSKHCVEVTINSPLKNLPEKNVTESLQLPSDCLAVRSDRIVFCVSLCVSRIPEEYVVIFSRLEMTWVGGSTCSSFPAAVPSVQRVLKNGGLFGSCDMSSIHMVSSLQYSNRTASKIPFISGKWTLVTDWASVGEKMILVSPRHRRSSSLLNPATCSQWVTEFSTSMPWLNTLSSILQFHSLFPIAQQYANQKEFMTFTILR